MNAVIGLGSDLLRIERIARLGLRHGAMLLDRMLAPAERGDVASEWPDCAPEIAALVACKEAFFKALGTGLVMPLRWADVAVRRSSLTLSGASADAFAARGGRETAVSVSGGDGFVLATVLLLGTRIETR
jgi:holo-[acyl-carrier protein] synthase